LMKNLYMHFFIEHNNGHHRNVATPLDPATSKCGETFYNFLPKTIIGGFLSAWEIENERCVREYGKKYSIGNKMIYFSLSYIVIPIFVSFLFGFKAACLFIITAFFSVVLLESINYIEHYGLERKIQPDGKYENINITHSWNAPHRVSNYLLFKLQRHSDHHENSLKPYQTLCSYEESPTLPTGYSVCLLMSFFPRVWFNIMNPLVELYIKGEKVTEQKMKGINSLLLKFIVKVNLVLFTMLLVQANL
jgi:alkane 1-monooxygenase